MAGKQTLGEYIKAQRVGIDMRLRELARRLEVTPSYVSDIENDRRVPSEEVLRRISVELELHLDELVARAGRLGNDAERYLRETPAATTLFRRISEQKLSDEELARLLKRVERMRPDQDGKE